MLLTLKNLKKNLTGCRLCRAGNQISVFHATFYTRVKAGSCPAIHHIHPGALPGCSWKKTGHRQEPEQPLGQEAVSVSAQVLALTSPEHHFEVCQWGAPSKLHVLSTGASATQNARWTHRGLNAKEKASHGAMRSTQLRKSRKRLCPMAPRDHLQNWVQAQDFYFCLDTRQKIALCASCGMTKLENKLYGGFGWHSCHGRLCVSFASVEC